MRFFVGADAQNIQRRRFNLTGSRMFSGAYGPCSRFTQEEAPLVQGFLDSGAFSDAPEDRLEPSAALERQFAWERRAERFWGVPWRAWGLVSYDLLIDEKWTGRARKKQRWSVAEADRAVEVTVAAAGYLASQRERTGERRICLAVQGVDAQQYADCAAGVLAHARPGDIFGLGGWCILGLQRGWIPTFWASLRRVLPLVAAAGVDHAHIFGVMYRPALGGLLWLADQHGIAISTDSSGPALAVTWRSEVRKRSGAVYPDWESNVAHHVHDLANLRSSRWYTEPPAGDGRNQLTFFYGGA